jgi:NitT/TauT family transport system permease protein
MTTELSLPAAAEAQSPKPPKISNRRVTPGMVMAVIASAVALAVHRLIPDQQVAITSHVYAHVLLASIALGGCVLIVHWICSAFHNQLGIFGSVWSVVSAWLVFNAPLVAGAFFVLAAWDLVTLKQVLAPLGVSLPLPFFPGPDMVFQSFLADWRELADCAWHSLLLLASGYSLGVLAGLICGVSIGWSMRARYWGMAVLKIIGPMPATAWIPLAMVICPGSQVAAMSIIALAVWFPVSMLTISGVSNVRVSYLDVARTLGAGRFYLIFRVAIPAAMPSIFIGLFMGLGASFLTLVVAEGIGVSSGLAWYADEARSGMEYSKIYASLFITAIFFSIIMTLLFKVRDRVLVWQKGVLKW